MEYKQKEKQDEISKPVLAHARAPYKLKKEGMDYAPIALFGFIGAILYIFITHDLISAGFIWFLGLMVFFSLSAVFGYLVDRYFAKRRLIKAAAKKYNPDSESDR